MKGISNDKIQAVQQIVQNKLMMQGKIFDVDAPISAQDINPQKEGFAEKVEGL